MQAAMSWNYDTGRATVKADSLYTFAPDEGLNKADPDNPYLFLAELKGHYSPPVVLCQFFMEESSWIPYHIRGKMWMTA